MAELITSANRFKIVKSVHGMKEEEVGTFPTFTEAETYLKALGDTAVAGASSHVAFDIIDRSKNVLVDQADETEQKELDRRLKLAAQRKELLALEAENAATEKRLKTQTVTAEDPPK